MTTPKKTKAPDQTLKVYQREKISVNLRLAQPDWTPKQRELLEIIRDKNTKIVLLKGPAGSTKTTVAMFAALEMLNSGRIKEIHMVRSLAEAGQINMGSLPGDGDEKMLPFLMPFYEKLSQLLPQDQIKYLKTDNRVINTPVNYLRGREFNAAFVLTDEAQSMTMDELQTCMTRTGKYSKMIVMGDTEQIDFVKGHKIKSGFQTFWKWYDKPEAAAQGIRCFKFGVEDIMREDIVKYLVQEYDALRLDVAQGAKPA